MFKFEEDKDEINNQTVNYKKQKSEINNMNFYEKELSKCKINLNGFGCAHENCEHKEAVYGNFYLPYCNESEECMKKNIEYLILENTKQKGQIEGLVTIIDKLKSNSSQNNLHPMNYSSNSFEESSDTFNF
jgi:hypothetical protein